MKKGAVIRIAIISVYFIFLVVALVTGFNPGKEIGYNFLIFTVDMLKILPAAFILIGLFEVWVKKETVEKHLGKGAGIRGYLWAVVIAGTTVGGIYVAFPVAYSLYSKGARLSIIFTYISASAICRIPMTIFEASFLGIKFSIIRLLVSIPLVIITSMLLGNYLEKRTYKINRVR
ncbi:permease [Chloroflexota bacterium]